MSLYGSMNADHHLGSSTSSINSIGSSLSSLAHSSLSINGQTTVTTTPDTNNLAAVNHLNQPASVNTFGSVNPDITSEIDLNTTSETDADERKKNYEPNILERALERTICYHPRRRSKPSKLSIGILSIFVVICHSVSLVILPIYASSMRGAGSDEGVMTLIIAGLVPFFMIPLALVLRHLHDKTITMRPTASLCLYVAMGTCYAVGLNMLMMSSNPDRTPSSLQPHFSAIGIIFTVIAYLTIKRKAISCRRLFCVLVSIAGVYVMAEPIIWQLQGSDDLDLFSENTIEAIVWPVIFSCSYLPMAIFYVLADRELKKNKVHPFSLATSSLLAGVVFTMALFGTDFIPWYGHVDDFQEYWEKIKTGYRCNFTYSTDCKHTLIKLIILASCLLCVNAFSFILIYATEGAVFTALISALAIPVAQGFWSLFDYDYDSDVFSWSPSFSHSTAFVLGGMGLALPAVIVYSVFSEKDARNFKRETKGYSDVSSSEYD